MKKVIAIFVLVLLVLTGCQADTDSNEEIYDKVVFFTHRNNIFSLSSNGDIEFIVESSNPSNLNIWEGYLYYLEFLETRTETEDTALIRLNLQSRTREVLDTGRFRRLTVADGLIFFVEFTFFYEPRFPSQERNFTLYMRTLDDKTRHVVFSQNEEGNRGHEYQYYNGYVYLLNFPNNALYRIDLNEMEKEFIGVTIQISAHRSPNFFKIYDGYIHYTIELWETQLNRMNLSGEDHEIVVEMPFICYYRFHNGHLYFISGENIYKAELDGTNAERIFEGRRVSIIAISCNYVLARYQPNIMNRDEYQLLLIRSDGSMLYSVIKTPER